MSDIIPLPDDASDIIYIPNPESEHDAYCNAIAEFSRMPLPYQIRQHFVLKTMLLEESLARRGQTLEQFDNMEAARYGWRYGGILGDSNTQHTAIETAFEEGSISTLSTLYIQAEIIQDKLYETDSNTKFGIDPHAFSVDEMIRECALARTSISNAEAARSAFLMDLTEGTRALYDNDKNRHMLEQALYPPLVEKIERKYDLLSRVKQQCEGYELRTIYNTFNEEAFTELYYLKALGEHIPEDTPSPHSLAQRLMMLPQSANIPPEYMSAVTMFLASDAMMAVLSEIVEKASHGILAR